ncbi:MAG: hypothetical protein COU82_00535 [Candidatus Portnoybacteria bacterium CG10_big_fil_rev_8_21_14_0_10_38_18]|uniref:Cell wall hydrolase SleB domain-containing protein n=1 Tax=Candidatus Portnoybacteria bacterium CG10_big_fil_rev_8_21_14_0_10_38_18 TaxID=1974813 RepID=A0A2M8KCN7_9BACT|nr:MAG: hypothetical protein COU82_00535 [Candidatus Portnoybacteria bacterium CG10_big_fil_rev_8_21_14_0_10_38_18]
MKRKITQQYNHSFEVFKPGLVATFISARCRSRKQLNSNKDEDLRVEINGLQFREIPPEKRTQLFNIPASWNGSKLRGLKKTIVFLTVLNKGEHIISLVSQDSAFMEDIKVEELVDIQDLKFNLEEQAEDGDRRPWYTFVLIDLRLKTITAKVTTKYRWWDSDDVKIIIDGKVQKNKLSLFHRYWFWAGSLVKKLLKKETKEHTFEANLDQGIHYIEFWADKTPALHRVGLDLGKKVEFKHIPTVDDPKWTGNFWDDTEEMLLARLIYGEARNQPEEAKIWVAGAVINRVETDKVWPNTIKEVILEPKQYDVFKPEDSNYPYVIDPLKDNKETDKIAWQECYKIAKDIISGKLENPTEATHFHGIGISKDWFLKNIVPQGKFLRKIGDIYFYWSPN